jgi:hypothetical protein
MLLGSILIWYSLLSNPAQFYTTVQSFAVLQQSDIHPGSTASWTLFPAAGVL